MSLHPREEAAIRLFAHKDAQERLLSLAANEKRRADFIHDFLHDTRRLDRHRIIPLAPTSTVETIASELRKRGAGPRAFCISSNLALDRFEVPLVDALRAAVGSQTDTLVFAIGGLVAYHEDHEGERRLLHDRSAR